MAMAGGSNDPTDPNDFDPPKTPRMVVKLDDGSETLRPDTEDNVAEQTDGVFRNFMHQMFDLERRVGGGDADNTPNHPEITAFPDPPLSPASRVGRQLALIGDEINLRHTDSFNSMIRSLNLGPGTAYEAFAGVARRLFKDGVINWGRIITLLCFGYRLAVTVLERGINSFFSDIIGFLIRFVISEKIAKWIAEQGGWGAALRLVPESLGWNTLGAIFGIAALSVVTAIYLSKK